MFTSMYIGLNGNYDVGQVRTILLNLAITLLIALGIIC